MAKYITPAITPFTADGAVDLKAAAALYEYLVEGGVDGILVFGSIGEFFAVPMEQKKQLISVAVRTVAGRIPVLIGTADMLFDQVVELSNWALQEGADAVIVVPPFYFRLEGGQVETYYAELAKRIDGRLYLYNFPDRTGYSIPADVVKRLAQNYPNIAGVKDTISGVDHTRELIKAVKPVRPDFEVFSGFDDNFAHNVLCGGDGCIAGLSNVAPKLCHEWKTAVDAGDWEASARCQRIIDRLMDIYTVTTPFIPAIKKAVQLQGVPVGAAPGFPFTEATDIQTEQIRALLARDELLAHAEQQEVCVLHV